MVLKYRTRKATLSFLPAHTNVNGNERVDILTGTATIDDGTSVDFADILTVIRDCARL